MVLSFGLERFHRGKIFDCDKSKGLRYYKDNDQGYHDSNELISISLYKKSLMVILKFFYECLKFIFFSGLLIALQS